MSTLLLMSALLNLQPAGGELSIAIACRGTAASENAGVTVRDEPPAADDLRALRVTAAGGAYLLVHFDPVSEAVARRYAACFGAQLTALRAVLGDDRGDAQWASVVFTNNAAYVPPRGQGVRPRWIVPTAADGTLTERAGDRIAVVVPHEQVHDFQYRARASTPRWFAEGHATWAGLKVTEQIDPAAAAAERTKFNERLAGLNAPLDLPGWGGVRPRREAIMRQVSPEDRARMEREPDYMPQGTFTFLPGDLIGDESNMPARYAASWQVFDGLERRHGIAKVRAFAADVTAREGRVTAAALSEAVQRHFGESLETLLADRPSR